MSYTFIDDIAPNAKTRRPASGGYYSWGKRCADILVVVLSAPIVLPVLIMAWFMTMIGGGNAFYSQPRIGRDGRTFRCLKIRTMVPDAEKVLDDLIKSDPRIAKEWATHQKLENDPRITTVGRILRQTSIDELPQLWNVLTGEMSLIGPRPFTPDQKEMYDSVGKNAYYRLRPGVSGLWQVECRHASTFQERVSYDETYSKNLSVMSDLKIAARTVGVVLKATGS